ncbi:MAG: Ig-like domain-containing protein, partial [Actinomycetota bacterium]
GSSEPPPNSAPTAADASATTPADTAVTVTLSATDPETCELDFSTTTSPASGTLSALTDRACSTESPNSDTAEVTYTPASGFTGTDSFSFKASDGELDSNPATVTITVTEPGAPTDISFVAASSAANATATTLSIDRPAGVAAGDVMLASIDVRGKPQVTPPVGWTLIRSDVNGSALKLETYYRSAGSSEPASYTWTFPVERGAAGGIAAFSGVDTGAPVDASGGQVNASSTLITAPSITTTVPDTMLVGSFAIRGATQIAPPSGMTERWDLASTGSSKITSAGATEARAATGATGERVATAAKDAPSIAHLVALKPGP